MGERLRVGVIGLGPRWQKRYKPALRALRKQFELRALCGQVQHRAALEAKRLGCDAVDGPTQLLERDDVEAVLLLDTQWFRLWPVEQACRLGKPVFCCSSLELDDAHADVLHQHARASRVPVVMEMLPRFAWVSSRLRELFEGELGTPRLLLCNLTQARGSLRHSKRRQTSRLCELLGSAGITLVDWCLWLLGGKPQKVLATGSEGLGFGSVLLELSDGRAVQITRHRGPGPRRALRLEVVTERSVATAQLPRQLTWITPDGQHSHRPVRPVPLGRVLLENFWQIVRGSIPAEPSLADAYRALGYLRAAAESWQQGRRITLAG